MPAQFNGQWKTSSLPEELCSAKLHGKPMLSFVTAEACGQAEYSTRRQFKNLLLHILYWSTSQLLCRYFFMHGLITNVFISYQNGACELL
jgi:hypothetical protein